VRFISILLFIILLPCHLSAQTNSVPPGLTGLGDSYTVGLGGSPDYLDLIAPNFGGTETNLGVSGDLAIDIAWNVVYTGNSLWNTAGTSVDKTLMVGLNDADYYGVGSKEVIYTQSLQAIIALMAIPRSDLVFGQDSGCVPTGTWDNWTMPSANGMGKHSDTNGSVLTCTVTANSKGIIYVAYYASDHNTGTMAVKIDGSTPGSNATLTAGYAGGSNIESPNGTSQTYWLARYAGLTPGSHTFTFTVTSATGSSQLDNVVAWLGGPFTVTPQNLTVYAAGVVYQQNNTNGTATAQYNSDAQTAIQQLQNDGLPVQWVNIRAYLNSSTDYNGGTPAAPSMPSTARTPGVLISTCVVSNDLPLHPGNCGHAHIAEAFIARRVAVGQLGVITGPTCGNYADFASSNVAPHWAASSEAQYDGSQTTPPSSIAGTQADPTYGCTIKRLTNAPVTPGNGNFCAHEYSNMTAVNANDTLVLMSCNSYFLADLSGNVIVPPGNLPWGGGVGSRWDPVNPKVFYYMNNPNTTNVLKQGTVPTNTGACAPSCTITSTTLHTFSEYTTINFGGGEGDLFSPDHILLNGTRVSDGSLDVFVYTISTDTKGPVANFSAALNFDNAEITGSNQMVINWGVDQSPIGSCSSPPCHTGFELFGSTCNGVGCSPANANFVRHLSDTHSHSVESRDVNGNDIVMALDVYPRTPGCAGQDGGGEGGIVSIRVDGSGITCIVTTPWTSTLHMGSTRNLSGQNWINVSIEDSSGFTGNNSGSATYPLNGNWNLTTNSSNTPTSAGQWGYLSNDSFLLTPEGTALYRMYQDRSRPGTADYWKQSRACISRDGGYVIYDSDFGQGQNFSGVTDYIDVYAMATGITSGSTGASGAGASGGTVMKGGAVVTN
jgi:hypothetical protein